MTNDRIPARAPLYISVPAICAAALLAGCSSPTYGTGKSSNQQLLEDVTGILSIGPSNSREQEIAYTPRGQLVRPGSFDVLPQPQVDAASAENPAWPESPEERRRRIRAEADERGGTHPALAGARPAQQTSAGYDDPERWGSQPMTRTDRAAVQERIRIANQGEATQRRFLSEPPLQYRVPSDGAPAGDIGTDERVKEREARRAARGGGSWRDYVPWL